MRFSAGIVAGGYSAEALALFARFTTPPTESRKVAINRLITRGKSFGWWQKLDVLVVLAAADSQASTRNWIGDIYNATPTSSPTFEADHGFVGDGTTSYISTGFNPTTAVSPKFTLNDATMFLFSNTNVANGASPSGDLGNLNSALRRDTATQSDLTGNSNVRANNATSAGGAHDAYPGFTAYVRPSSTQWKAYTNTGGLYQTVTANSTALTNAEFLALRIPSISFGKNQLGAYGWGSAMSDAEVTDLRGALVDYMLTVGSLSHLIYLDGDSYSTTQGGVGMGLSLIADTARTVVTYGVGGDTLANETARVLSNAAQLSKSTLIFWDGDSNGYGTLANDMALYAQIAAAYPRSIIIPPVRRAIDDAGDLAAISALQTAIASTYAGRTIDAQALLAAAATSPGDDADVAANVVPRSLLIDPVTNAHLNSSGWSAIMPALEALITSLGYN